MRIVGKEPFYLVEIYTLDLSLCSEYIIQQGFHSIQLTLAQMNFGRITGGSITVSYSDGF